MNHRRRVEPRGSPPDAAPRVLRPGRVFARTPAGSFLVSLSRKTVTPWLSAFGKRAQRQTMTPGRSLDLGATHTPGPAAPTHTASGDDDTDFARIDGPARRLHADDASLVLADRGHLAVLNDVHAEPIGGAG